MMKYILIAGVNGAGKSTLYQILESLKNIPRINTDEIVRSFGDWRNISDVMKAGKIAIERIESLFNAGETFNQETTLCGNSIQKNIMRAKALGYSVEMHYVGLNSVEIAKERISHRVAHGGHGIPDKDVERRYVESMKKLVEFIPICDMVVLYDNTESFIRFATYEKGKLHNILNPVPEWYKRLEIES